ncbi:hypothetical protein B0I73DRAFT_131331 [Yarrowia lipolytica]|nr:hypothetical protein B0I73DRAFT_131331 [Yarrowia lipolytica]
MTDYSTTPVVVSLEELQSGATDSLLPSAFGPDSLGVIIVTGLPKDFVSLRQKVLLSASDLAALPADKLAAMEHEPSFWCQGWSRGREKLANGVPDFNKGSFYANCAFHKDPQLEAPPKEETVGYEDMHMYTAPNIWPQEEDLPQFQTNLKALCNLIIDVAEHVARACDRYVAGHAKIDGYTAGYLEDVVRTSTTTKARLLHYFPMQQQQEQADTPDDAWCGTHKDHSCLTGLTSAMFLDGKTVLPKSPDPEAGLYIHNRHGKVVQVKIPADALAFQTGSALEAATHGEFKAVPHFVKGANVAGVSRNTLAVFCQPSMHRQLGSEGSFAEYSTRILEGNH